MFRYRPSHLYDFFFFLSPEAYNGFVYPKTHPKPFVLVLRCCFAADPSLGNPRGALQGVGVLNKQTQQVEAACLQDVSLFI